jgi:serine/threonine protein kinase
LKNHKTSECPSAEALTALLYLDPSEQSSLNLRIHVRACSTCQQTLDELTSHPALDSLRKPLDAEYSEPEKLTKIKREIRELLIDSHLVGNTASDSHREVGPGISNPSLNTILSAAELETTSGRPSPNTVVEEVEDRRKTKEMPANVGRYSILSVLGSGGMGTVYLAFDPKVNRKVAIKTINQQRPDLHQRLEREAEAIGRINSDLVVRLYALESDEQGNSYIVMEYIDGETLSGRLARVGKLKPAEAASISMTAAQGVAAAHACGVLHRDIKPGNILIDQNGKIKVADFGLAAFTELSPRLTRQDNLPGTPAYFSPELVRGSRHSVASDVYSLGCVLHECLTGKPAVTGTPMEIIQRLANDQIPALDSRDTKIPEPLRIIRDRAMAVEPARRYTTAQALSDDLQRWLDGKPILARPESMLQRIQRNLQRKPRQTALIAILTTIFVAIAGYAAWANWQSRRDKEQALIANREALKSTSEADRQRELALKQLQQTVFQTQEMLKDRSGTLELRKSLLESALEGLEQVAQTGSSLQIDRSTALAHLRLGQIQLALGDIEAGRDSLRQAKEIAIANHLDSAADAQSCRDLAAILNSLGETEFSQRDHGTARTYFEQSLELREIAFQIDAGQLSDLTAYSMNLIRLGDVANTTGDGQLADEYYQQVLTTVEDEHLRFSQSPELQRSAAIAVNRLFVRAQSRGDSVKAREFLDQWKQISNELLQAEPHNVEYQFDHALALAQTARFRLMQDDFAAATRFAQDASEAYRRIAQAEPQSALAQSRLATSLHQEADAWYATGDFEQACDRWQEAAEIHADLFAQNPSNTRFALLGGESWLWHGIAELDGGRIESGLMALDKAVTSFSAAEAGSNSDPQVVQPVTAVRQLVEQLGVATRLIDEDPPLRVQAGPTVSMMCGFYLSRINQIDDSLALAEYWQHFATDDVAVMVNVHSLRAAIYVRAMEMASENQRSQYRDQAISALRTTLATQPAWLAIMRKSPNYLVLRSDSAYQELLSSALPVK